MALIVASLALSDDEFLAEFTSCRLPPASFRHGDHLRLAWICLHRSPDDAPATVRNAIQNYARHHGVAHIYHETITMAWVKLLATHSEATFEEFLRLHQHRLTRDLLQRFWSVEALDSELARRQWVPPDRQSLPV